MKENEEMPLSVPNIGTFYDIIFKYDINLTSCGHVTL